MAPGKLIQQRERAIEMLSEGLKTQGAIAKEIGVSERSINNWLNEPDFAEQVIARSRRVVRRWLPVLYRVLVKQAVSGEAWAARLMLEHIERLENAESKQTATSYVVRWDSRVRAVAAQADED